MTGEKTGEYGERGGDNFILTPLFLGCAATGWQSMKTYMTRNGPLTLASAMAASGAAANGNAGYLGTGITRGAVVSALMTLLNMRLGLWVRNPSNPARWPLGRFPSYYRPVLSALFGGGHKRNSAFVELSDGGHFENLGLYELVRRKVNLIILIDAESDQNLSMAAFLSAQRRVKEDFGATIVANTEDIARIVPAISAKYPPDARFSQSPFFVVAIEYADSTRGTLIYIKAAMAPHVSLGVSGFKALNPNFPFESTVNQFFTPIQADAYMSLGYQCGEITIDALNLPQCFNCPGDILERYRKLQAEGTEPVRDQTR